MTTKIRRVVTGHDERGKSMLISDEEAAHFQPYGVDFFEIWSESAEVPILTSAPKQEPNEQGFSLMPNSGHLVRIIDIKPLKHGGQRSVMHRTKSLDYGLVLEGEVVLIFDDSEVVLKKDDIVIQRGTNHAWENRSDAMARMVFFIVNAEFSEELLNKLPKPIELLR